MGNQFDDGGACEFETFIPVDSDFQAIAAALVCIHDFVHPKQVPALSTPALKRPSNEESLARIPDLIRGLKAALRSHGGMKGYYRIKGRISNLHVLQVGDHGLRWQGAKGRLADHRLMASPAVPSIDSCTAKRARLKTSPQRSELFCTSHPYEQNKAVPYKILDCEQSRHPAWPSKFLPVEFVRDPARGCNRDF
jgi:hypothetical protein